MSQHLSNSMAYVTQKNTKSFAWVWTVPAKLFYVFPVSEQDFIKAYMQNLALSEKYELTLLSHLCLMGPALGQHVEASVFLAKVPDFLAELLPTGAFYPQAVLLLPGLSPIPTHTHTPMPIPPPPTTHTTSLFHTNSSLFKCLCPLPSLWPGLWRNHGHQSFI